MAQLHSKQISKAVDLLLPLESPWELTYLVLAMFSSLAFQFIFLINLAQHVVFENLMLEGVSVADEHSVAQFDLFFYQVSNSMSLRPVQTAKPRLASLPLGSIRPQSSCFTVYTWHGFKDAVVPPMFDSQRPILIYQRFISIFSCSQNQTTTRQVIIFVREATYRLFLLLNETTTFMLYSVTSLTMQLLAVILGGGLKGLAQFLLICFISNSLAFLSSSLLLYFSLLQKLLILMLFPLIPFSLLITSQSQGPSGLLNPMHLAEQATFLVAEWIFILSLFSLTKNCFGSRFTGAIKLISQFFLSFASPIVLVFSEQANKLISDFFGEICQTQLLISSERFVLIRFC